MEKMKTKSSTTGRVLRKSEQSVWLAHVLAAQVFGEFNERAELLSRGQPLDETQLAARQLKEHAPRGGGRCFVSTRSQKSRVLKLDGKLAKASAVQLDRWIFRATNRSSELQTQFEHHSKQAAESERPEHRARFALSAQRMGITLMNLDLFRGRAEEQLEHRVKSRE